jgi:hypothetical protein
MTACDRFETEGLARFVAGEPLGPHVEGCPDCAAALARYQKLAAALANAQNDYVPPGDWEAKAWARIAQASPVRPRGRAAALLGLGACFAALGVFFLSSSGGPEALVLTAQVQRSNGPLVRGGPALAGQVQSAAPGDVLHLVARVPRGKVGDMRVYRGPNELVFQCATSAACLRTKDGLEAKVTLERVGTYRTLLIAADKGLPPATGNLDADHAAAIGAGAAQESAPIEVL